MIETAQAAGRLALDWLQKGARSWEKGLGEPVTEADLAVNELVASHLLPRRPSYGWLSEESPDDPAARMRPRVFVVDPIDGTRAFIERKPGFCVSIGLVHGQEAVAGVLVNPMTDEVFAARRGGGATLNGVRIRSCDANSIDAARIILRPASAIARFKAQAPGVAYMDSPPSSIAYRMALVAKGDWHAVLSPGAKSDWDLAAAAAILREAGARVTDFAGQPFQFNRESTLQNGMAAAGATLHPLLIDAVRSVESRA